MNGDKEIIAYMQESIDMGIEALETLAKNLESTDNKIKSNVLKALECYKCFQKKCSVFAKDGEPIKKGNLLSVIMAKMGTKAEFMKDNSDAKIADTLIQGYNMGVIDITKKIKKYKGDVSKEVLKLANEYKEMQEKGIRDVKGFL